MLTENERIPKKVVQEEDDEFVENLDEFLAKLNCNWHIGKAFSSSTCVKNSHLEITTTSNFGFRDPLQSAQEHSIPQSINKEIENFDFSPNPHQHCCCSVIGQNEEADTSSVEACLVPDIVHHSTAYNKQLESHVRPEPPYHVGVLQKSCRPGTSTRHWYNHCTKGTCTNYMALFNKKL